MGCPPVRGDNPQALASGLSCVQVDKHGITILYHLHQCRLAHHEIFNAQVGKGGIKPGKLYTKRYKPGSQFSCLPIIGNFNVIIDFRVHSTSLPCKKCFVM